VKTNLSPELEAILYNHDQHERADCWTFEFADGTRRWTDYGIPIVSGGHVFAAGPGLERDRDLSVKAGLEVDDLGLAVLPDATTIGGLSMVQSAVRRLWDDVTVTLESAYMITPGDASAGLVPEFVGYVERAEPTATGIAVLVKSLTAKLAAPVPTRTKLPQCPYTLGDESCGVNLAAFTDARTAAVGSTAALVKLNASSTRALAGSLIRITSGPMAGQSRMLRSASGVDCVPAVPFYSAPGAGVSVVVVRGCNKTRPECHGVFANKLKFGGFPDAPKGEVV
jgi:uncharacterized phage protein (TIGR02218 family)